MRPLLVAGFVLAVIVVGTLGLVQSQGNAEQQQQRYAIAYETSAAATSDTISATMVARQLAEGATDTVKQQAIADSGRATLQASLTAIAVGVHATSTAAAAKQ